MLMGKPHDDDIIIDENGSEKEKHDITYVERLGK